MGTITTETESKIHLQLARDIINSKNIIVAMALMGDADVLLREGTLSAHRHLSLQHLYINVELLHSLKL